MPFNENIRRISPLAWMMMVSCAANVLTAVTVLWLVTTGTLRVEGGVYVENSRLKVEVIR